MVSSAPPFTFLKARAVHVNSTTEVAAVIDNITGSINVVNMFFILLIHRTIQAWALIPFSTSSAKQHPERRADCGTKRTISPAVLYG
jgi:hypothetical protein